MTFNPWPSSDWIAIVAERGLAALLVLAMAILGIAIGAMRQLRRAIDPSDALGATALLGTFAGATVAGMFDAVLLLAMPSLLVWAALGALGRPSEEARTSWLPSVVRYAVAIAIVLATAGGLYRSGAQLVAMEIYATRSDRASLVRAAEIDPSNHRLRLRLARSGKRAERCEHARAALALYPHASAADAAVRHSCRDGRQ